MRHPGVTPDLLHRFMPPAGLARSAPRDVRLTGAGRALMALTWLLAAAAIVAGALLYREASRQAAVIAAFGQRGVTTTAVIERVWRKTGDGKPAFASFHFDAAGTRVHGETRMELDAWRELRAGSHVAVRHLPDDPSRWMVDGARRKQLPFAVPFVVSGLLASIALLCVFAITRQRSLLRDGRLAPAVVTAITTSKGTHGETHRQITYQFPLLGGGVAVGKGTAPKTSAVGGTIVVVYDPNHPGRNHPYPFSLVIADHS